MVYSVDIMSYILDISMEIFSKYIIYMPFQSEKQRRLCWYLYTKDKKKGKKPSWDCKKWSKETKKKKLPLYKSKRSKSSRKRSKNL